MLNFLKSKTKQTPVSEKTLDCSVITTHSKKQYVYIGYGEEVADDMPASMIRRGFHIAEHDGTLDDAFVEFIPMFDTPNKKSFSWWVNDTYPDKIITKENMGKLFFDYMMETRFSLTQQNMDKYWETAPMAECIHSLILPIYNSNISIDFIEEPKAFNYKMSDRFVEKVTAVLEAKYGEGNVFVSKQVVPVQTMLTSWGEFSKQESECIKGNYRYYKGKWDTQEFAANGIMLPLFGIPVGIRTKIPRVVKLANHYDMLKTLTNTYFDIPDFYQMVSECIPGAGSAKMRPYLLDIDQAFARLNYLLDMYLSILSRESREAFDEVCAKIKNRYGTSGERGGSAWANIWVKPSTLA